MVCVTHNFRTFTLYFQLFWRRYWYKRLFLICVFVTTTLILAQFATADYTLRNGSVTDPVWVTYSVWRPAGRDVSGNWWPEGWRTRGWYKIEPSAMTNLWVPAGSTWVYIRVERDVGEVKPADHATRDAFLFWIHPSEAFTSVETTEGNFLDSDHNRWSLEQANLYQYRNGGSHTILDAPRLPDLPAQDIYDQAMPSVVAIFTDTAKGSGVLIDKARQLVVTNYHVISGANEIHVVFPYKEQNGQLNKKTDFYVDNLEWLQTEGYVVRGAVIRQNIRNDLAIVQLNHLPATTLEIKHDFSKNVEDSMRRGDKIHILGNPGEQLWRWTQGTFVSDGRMCLPSRGDCLVMEAGTRGGNSGGPVLNSQGMLIGILTASDDETISAAAPTRNIRSLLDTVPAILPPIPPQRTYPKQVFKIRNNTGGTVRYQIKWSNSDDWQFNSLDTGYIMTHWSGGQNIPANYPQIRFDYIAGDGQQITYRQYFLETAQFRENNDHAPIYFFRYNRWGNRLDLFRDRNAGAAPALSKSVPEENALFANYPNPFNPETWIPYQLAKPAEVKIAIYAADGTLVRTLSLGHQPAGVYQSKGRAAYWDGTNALGEPVASGLYFYTLKVSGEFTATRKMLIQK